MIVALERYAKAHLVEHCAPIEQDGYASEYFKAMVESVRYLLSMPTGGLDGGTVDARLNDLLAFAGFES